MFVTGIQDLLSNADNNAFGILCLATSLLSKADKYSLYCTKTEIDWRSRSLRSALDIRGSLKWVTTKVIWETRHIQQLFRHLGTKTYNLHILLADHILACQLTKQGPYVNGSNICWDENYKKVKGVSIKLYRPKMKGRCIVPQVNRKHRT